MRTQTITITLFDKRTKGFSFERWKPLPGWRLHLLWFVEVNYWRQSKEAQSLTGVALNLADTPQKSETPSPLTDNQ